MKKPINASPNLRMKSVVDLPSSTAKDLPVSANQVRLLNERLILGVPVDPVQAEIVLTIATNPTKNNTVTIGSEVYTFVESVATHPLDVIIGEDVAATQVSLKTLLDTSALVTAGEWGSDAITLTAKTAGVIGNNLGYSVSFEEGVTDGFAEDMAVDGVDGTVASAPTFMVDGEGHVLYVAEKDCTTAVSNWKSVALS